MFPKHVAQFTVKSTSLQNFCGDITRISYCKKLKKKMYRFNDNILIVLNSMDFPTNFTDCFIVQSTLKLWSLASP